MEIREIEIEDAKGLCDLIMQVDSESPFMLFGEGERNLKTEQMEQRIEGAKKEENSTIFVAEDKDKLVGYLMVIGGSARKNRHSVYLVCGIIKDYRGQGVGTRLFTKLNEWVIINKISRIELTVASSNQAGLALYKKMGFEIEGTKRNSLLIDGEYVDEFYMSRLI